MSELWSTLAVSLSATLWIIVVLFRVILKWISRRTAVALSVVATVLAAFRIAADGRWVHAAAISVCVPLMLWIWRPQSARRG